ncbi:MAG: HAD family phosphatase [Clostridia bacterium]|nr:HAD family phosphatase [Clostridia bacterium]
MIQNYIFDLGQVLLRFVPREIVADFTDDPCAIKAITETMFDRLYWDRLDDGTISDEETKALACQRLPKEYHEAACLAFDRCFQTRPIIEGMPSLLSDLKKTGAGLYLLSNISCFFAEHYRETPHLAQLLSPFDGLVFSGPLHVTKPSREIFSYLLGKYDLKAEECLFIDDSQINLDGAARVGIQGYLFDGDVLKLRRALLP